MTSYSRIVLIGILTSFSINSFASKAIAPFPSNKDEIRFMEKINKKLDKAQDHALKFLLQYNESELRYHFNTEIEDKVNFEKKFAIKVTDIHDFESITSLLTYISTPKYRLDFITAVTNEINTLGSFKVYKKRSLYSSKAKLCLAGKVGLGTVGVGLVGVSAVSLMGLGFMPFWSAPLGWYLVGGSLGGIGLSAITFESMTKYRCYGKK